MTGVPSSTDFDRSHGSPYDRGDSDAYYGRGRFAKPHKWLDRLGREEVLLTDLEEIRQYYLGFDENPSGQKDWG